MENVERLKSALPGHQNGQNRTHVDVRTDPTRTIFRHADPNGPSRTHGHAKYNPCLRTDGTKKVQTEKE